MPWKVEAFLYNVGHHSGERLVLGFNHYPALTACLAPKVSTNYTAILLNMLHVPSISLNLSTVRSWWHIAPYAVRINFPTCIDSNAL